MTLKEYMTKYRMDVLKFAYECGVPYSSMWSYISGKHKPRQRVAERIEITSDKLVTVKELRGKDDRDD